MTEIDALEKKINEHEERMTGSIIRGHVKDFADYQRICGIIYGLNLARLDIQELRQKMENDD